MSKLVYITNASLDGYIEDKPAPSIGAIRIKYSISSQSQCGRSEPISLGGGSLRRWRTRMGKLEGYPPEYRAFARVWQKAEQIVISRTLTGAPTRIARVERQFDPEATRKLKRESAHDIFIGGAELAGLALECDLVDECHLFLHPVIVGGGKPAFRAAIRRDLELLETRRFGTGAIHLRYRVRGATP